MDERTSFFANSYPQEEFCRAHSFSFAVFDLESDGTQIHEFCCRFEGQSLKASGDQVRERLKELLGVLERTQLIVGHNIRRWDLPILGRPRAQIWDTLELELLLNPCRRSYALLGPHHAEGDCSLTEELFFRQIMQLAEDPALSLELSPFLPSFLLPLLKAFSQQKTRLVAVGSGSFFADRLPLASRLKDELCALAIEPEKNLILAPTDSIPIFPSFFLSFSCTFPPQSGPASKKSTAAKS